MDVGATAATPPASSAQRASIGLAGDFDAFLKLLTTQLANQDPLSPLDPNQFTQQLVQFSGVEQAIRTNKALEQLIGLAQAGEAARALDYIGTEIEARGDWVSLDASAGAIVTYSVPADAVAVRLRLFDEAGRLVLEGQGAVQAGPQSFHWDGRGADGRVAPPGRYRVEITALDHAGKASPLASGLRGRVDAVELRPDGPTLAVGSLSIPLAEVVRIRRPEAGI